MSERAQDLTQTIKGLCRFKGRWAGTNAEREAANYLAKRLQELGRDAEIEPITIRPEYALVHAIHTALVAIGSIISVKAPFVGVVLILFAAISTFGDLTTRFYWTRKLLPRRASQNVFSPGCNPDTRFKLILTAHYDAARSGLAFNDRSIKLLAAIQRKLRVSIGPFTPVVWSIAVILILSVLRLNGVDPVMLTAVQFGFTVVMIIAFAFFVDIALSAPVPGANDNASGVAVVLRLLQELNEGKLTNLDLSAVFTGAEEGLMLGMREWIRTHSAEYRTETTYFINVDNVGSGTPRYLTREGFIFFFDFDRRLLEICERIAEADRQDGASLQALPLKYRSGTDALPPTLAGYPAISILAMREGNFLPNYHKASDVPANIVRGDLVHNFEFCRELIVQLDKELTGKNATPGNRSVPPDH